MALTSMLNESNINSTLNGLEQTPLSWVTKVILITAYTCAMTLAFVGNLVAIVVFTFGRRSRTDLRAFLISLAVSDFLMGCFCLPFTFTQIYLNIWPFAASLCPIVLYLQLLAVTSSVFTNTAIGLDRFWVVTFPLRSRLTRTQSKFVLIGLWMISGTISTVQLCVGKVMNNQCMEDWLYIFQRRIYTIFILILTYILPLTMLVLTYSIVGWKMWKRSVPGNAHQQRDMKQIKSKRRIIKMLVVIVTFFGICWLPLHVFFLIDDYGDLWKQISGNVVHMTFCISHWLAMANSFVNPIIYGFMNDSFRMDLFCLLSNNCPCLANQVYLQNTSVYAAVHSRFSREDADIRQLYRGGSTNRLLLAARYSVAGPSLKIDVFDKYSAGGGSCRTSREYRQLRSKESYFTSRGHESHALQTMKCVASSKPKLGSHVAHDHDEGTSPASGASNSSLDSLSPYEDSSSAAATAAVLVLNKTNRCCVTLDIHDSQ